MIRFGERGDCQSRLPLRTALQWRMPELTGQKKITFGEMRAPLAFAVS